MWWILPIMCYTPLDTRFMLDAEKPSGRDRSPAKEGEKMTTLTMSSELSAHDLVIADERKPVCIAGVLGGAYSGVSQATTQSI